MIAVREPGGTVLGDEIRRMLLDPGSDIVPRAEALLFMASRAQLVERGCVRRSTRADRCSSIDFSCPRTRIRARAAVSRTTISCREPHGDAGARLPISPSCSTSPRARVWRGSRGAERTIASSRRRRISTTASPPSSTIRNRGVAAASSGVRADRGRGRPRQRGRGVRRACTSFCASAGPLLSLWRPSAACVPAYTDEVRRAKQCGHAR